MNLNLLPPVDAPTGAAPDSAPDDVHRMLTQLCALASHSISGVEAVAVTLLRHGIPAQQVCNSYARAVDRIQHRTGEGPCLDAAAHRRTIVSGCLGGGEARWPQFVTAVRSLGVVSVMSVPVMADQDVIGTVKLYSRRPDAFDDTAIAMGELFAHRAAASLSRVWSPLSTGDAIGAVSELPADLVHGIEAVVGGMTNPALRSATVSQMIEEMFETLSWALGEPAQQLELASFTEVLAAAYAHEDRIAAWQTEAGAR